MSKVIAVTGATGSQGGGVVNVMKSTPGWKVRAITRNPESDAAQKLAAEGIEVVQADMNDENSMKKAFEGVSAVFAVTNWWEHLFTGKSQDESGEIEEAQGMNIARAAAANLATIEHYIWSTTPSAKRQFNGEHLTPHMDYKANVDARIKSELPDLAAKTTYLYFGYYPQNMAYLPILRPVEIPGSGAYVQVIASDPDAKVLLSGDLIVNSGIWVRQAILSGSKSYGKYANVALEKLTFRQMMEIWSEVTGKNGVVVQCTAKEWTEMWGLSGKELALQFKYGEMVDPWAVNDEFISPEDLGIDTKEVVGCRGTLERLNSAGLL